MTTEVLTRTGFFDALRMTQIINETLESLPGPESVVYVTDDLGNEAKVARFERRTLTDGSTVVDLVIEFDRA
jgi:hypothetical protein